MTPEQFADKWERPLQAAIFRGYMHRTKDGGELRANMNQDADLLRKILMQAFNELQPKPPAAANGKPAQHQEAKK